MKYIEIILKSETVNNISLETELMFDLATERVGGTELVRFTLNKQGDEKLDRRNFSTVLRLLRKMKSEKKIQFFATEQSFAESSTEAAFLLNKYPEQFENREKSSEFNEYIYVKL